MTPAITKLLSGGLNLLPAGDAIPEGQAIACQNWRTDQAGNLRSRKSNTAAVATPGGNIHTIISVKRSGGVSRYYGADDKLYRDATLLTTLNDGQPLGACSFQDRLWVTNRAQTIQSKDDGTNFWQWTITPPVGPVLSAAGVGTGSLNGEYIYYCSHLNAAGEESSAKFGAPIGPLTTDKVTVNQPVPGDPQVTHWNVYRQGGDYPLQAYKVNADPIPIATLTYDDDGADHTGTGGDDQTDYGLASLGVIRPTDHDPAPPARGVAGPYFNKLLAYSTAAHPNRIFWTPSDEPSYFPGSESEQDGNWVDVGDEGEEILGIAVFPRYVVILKEKSIHRLVGDPDDWGADIEKTNAEVGQIGAKAWAQAGSTVYGKATEYIFAFNGDRAESVSPQLNPLFKGDTINTVGALPTSLGAASCMAYRNGRLYVSFPTTTLVYEGGRWATDDRVFTALYDEGHGGALLGAYGGSVYELESGTNEANIPLIYQSRYENQGAPENQKRYSDVLVEHNTGGRTFTAYAYLDDGATVVNLGAFSSTSRTQSTFTIPEAEYRNISVRLECLTGNAAAEIYTLAAHYLPLERNARTYDSGKIPLGRIGYLTMIEADLDIVSGSVAWTLYSGVSDLSIIASGTFAGTVETFSARIPLDLQSADVDYRWARLVMTGTAFRCLGARLWSHDTGKIPLEKATTLSTIQMELEVISGSVDYHLFAGMGDPAATKSGTVAATGTVTAQPPIAVARWIRLVLVGDHFRYAGARIEVQPIGCYLEAGQTFRSGDLAFGGPRVVLFQQIRTECQGGANTGSFVTDTPGTMAERADVPLTAAPARNWQRRSLPMNTRGKICRFEITPASAMQIYAIQARGKIVGDGASGWQWFDIPVDPTPSGFTWMPLPEMKQISLK